MTQKIVVSACLAGLPCRYDCASQERDFIKLLVDQGEAIAVCPEQLGGLPTPRTPAEQVGEKVLTKDGHDVTAEYISGATAALSIVLTSGAEAAYLKSKSPMCGAGRIYDGSFTGTIASGDGIFTRYLKQHGIKINSVD